MFLWLFTLANYAVFYNRVMRAHSPYWPTLLSIFGLPLYAGLLRQSAKAHELGTVSWRGRSYDTTTTQSAPGGGPATPLGASKPSTASNSK
jgi:hypothetical protein